MAPPLDQERLARLKDELVAIDKWDEAYRREQTHDAIDKYSYAARQLRRQEVLRRIELLCCDLRQAS